MNTELTMIATITQLEKRVEQLTRELKTTHSNYGGLVDSLYQTIAELRTECATLIEERDKAETENARLRALLNAQDDFAHGGYVRLDSREDFHKVIGEGD